MVTAHARSLGRRRLVRSPRDPGTARRHPARTLRARRALGARRAAGLRRQSGARARRARARLRPGDGALGGGRVAAALPGAHSATALLLAFLPPLFAALLILLAGWLLANFLGQSILIAAVNA